jgi:hypothetical protein
MLANYCFLAIIDQVDYHKKKSKCKHVGYQYQHNNLDCQLARLFLNNNH